MLFRSEFYDEEIENRQQIAAESRGFIMQEHSLMIYGICAQQPCGHKK